MEWLTDNWLIVAGLGVLGLFLFRRRGHGFSGQHAGGHGSHRGGRRGGCH
jgi:hypothetical protein